METNTKNKKIKVNHAKACGLHCIKIKDFGVNFGTDVILEHVNLHIHCGRLTAFIGRNGAGKSTLLKAILNEVPHTGSIEFKDMRSCRFEKLRIGYVPQHINIEKNTPTSVYDLCASFLDAFPVFLWKRKRLYHEIKEHLKKFQADELIDKAVCDLSGGELQRVLLSIAIMPVPNLLILDEPVSGIDHNGMDLFYKTIDDMKRNYDLAIILVSHDLEYVAEYADSVILLDKTILKEGTPDEVFKSREFIETFGCVPVIKGGENDGCNI